MQDNKISQSWKGIVASVAGVLLVVLPILLDGSAVKWVAAIIGVCGALGVVVTPNAPTKAQYEDVARAVLGTSLVKAVTDRNGQLNTVTTDGTPTTVTITPNPEQGPYTSTSPTGAQDLSRPHAQTGDPAAGKHADVHNLVPGPDIGSDGIGLSVPLPHEPGSGYTEPPARPESPDTWR